MLDADEAEDVLWRGAYDGEYCEVYKTLVFVVVAIGFAVCGARIKSKK